MIGSRVRWVDPSQPEKTHEDLKERKALISYVLAGFFRSSATANTRLPAKPVTTGCDFFLSRNLLPFSSLYQVSFFVMKCLSLFPSLFSFDRSAKTLPLFILFFPAFPPLLLRVFQISNIRVALKP
jgi:hypothetical protein